VRSETGLQFWPDVTACGRPTVYRDITSVGYMRFSPDGNRLYLDGRSAGMLDLPSGEFTPFPESDGHWYVALSADGESLFVARTPPSHRSSLERWPAANPFSGKPPWRVRITRPYVVRPSGLPDGRILLEEGHYTPGFASRRYRFVIRS